MTAPAKGDDAGPDDRGVRVLLVDDDETWVESTASLLHHQRESFTVETATDLVTASDAITAVDPDCVVCDYDLESDTGLDLLAELRERDDDRPFILITGQGNESIASDAIGRQVTDYIPKRSLGGQDDLLARRVESAVDTYRTEQALARERRSKEAMLDILTATSSRTGLARKFCEHLVEQRDYECAWIGTVGESGAVVPRGSAGATAYLDEAIDPETSPAAGTEPALVALDRGEPHVVAPVDPDADDGWRAAAARHGFGSAAAVPIVHDGTQFGALAVYATGTEIPPGERDLLGEYAETIGYALRAAGWKESLLSTSPVALDIELTDGSVPLVALDRELPARTRIEVLTTVLRSERVLYVLRVEGAATDAVRRAVEATDAVGEVTVDRSGDPLRCELTAPLPIPETVLAEGGGRVVDVAVEHGRASITAMGSESGDAQSLVDAVRSAYPDAAVRSVRSSGPTTTRSGGRDLLGRLTDRQRRAVELAFYEGYFERPREHNATELAEKLGVSRQTFAQHLRSAERKLLSGLLDDERGD